MRFTGFIVFILCLHLKAAAQETPLEKLARPRLEYYAQKNAQSVLFVHYDKNVYTPNETAWFTGYIVKNTAPVTHEVLSVFLLRSRDSTIVQEEKFFIIQGICTGALTLKDSLEQGDYLLVAYTDVLTNGRPDASFVQPVTIKTAYDPSFTATLELADTITSQSANAKIRLQAYTKDLRALAGKQVEYTINGERTKTKTDKNGTVMIEAPLEKFGTDPTVKLLLKPDNEPKQLELRVPLPKKVASVKFYPEGGSLAENISCVTGWEAKDRDGTPISIQGILLKNGVPQDTVSTDGYGMGRFDLVPEPKAVYTFRLLGYNTIDTVYHLPVALPQGISMHARSALPGDTLLLEMKSTITERLYLAIHNYNEIFYSMALDVKQGRRQLFRIAIPPEMPRGIAAVTITDTAGHAMAERMVFMHFSSRPKLDVNVSEQQYGTRQPVELSLQVNKDAIPSNAVVSVACVQANRLLPGKMTDIESCMYLDNIISSMPFKLNRMEVSEGNTAYLENVLLIKGWRRYSWGGMMSVKPTDTVKHYSSLAFRGKVTRTYRPVKRPVELTFFTDKVMKTITTDSSGNFTVSPWSMEGIKVLAVVNQKNADEYEISLEDPYTKENKTYSCQLPALVMQRGTISNTDAWSLAKDERIRILEEVIVKGKKDNTLTGSSAVMHFGANECGDYVCIYNILNCSNHSTGTVPVAGRTYLQRFGQSFIKVAYQGCVMDRPENKSFFSMKGIRGVKEFYIPDSVDMKAVEPLQRSTLLWQHYVVVSKASPVKISFYTSDITGRFRVIVQGVTNDDVIRGETSFTVKK